MIRSLVAQVNPRLYARPYPRTSSRTTLAPSAAATSLVRSVELLSTTITSSTNSGIARSTFSIPCSSFRQGMITVMVRDLYMRPSFFECRASGYHGLYEADCVPFLLLGGDAVRHGSFHRAHRVPAEDVQGAGPIPGEPAYLAPCLPRCDRSQT